MTMATRKVLEEALRLPEKQRAVLAGRILSSLEPGRDEGVEAAWAREIDRRVRDLDRGAVKTIPWKRVRARILRNLNGHSRA